MKKYVIIKIGNGYTLKEKIKEGFFGAGLFRSRSLEKVEEYAKNNDMQVVAIGDIWEV